MCGWFPPHIQGLGEEQKRFLRLVSLSRSRKTDALEKHTPNQRLSICVPATPQVHVFFGSPCLVFSEREVQRRVFLHHNSYTRFPQMKARDPDADQSRGSLQGLSDPPPCGYSIQPISVIGLLFANDLLTDKWCVTNFIIMQLVFSEKWNPEISYSWMWTCCEELKVTDVDTD